MQPNRVGYAAATLLISQTQTIANPISAVLDALEVAMVGSCTRTETTPADLLVGDVGMSKDYNQVRTHLSFRQRHA